MFHNIQKHLLVVMIITLALVGLGTGSTTLADRSAQKAPPSASSLRLQRLNRLFATLKALEDQQEAKAVVSEIWMLWGRSGREDIDKLLVQASDRLARSQMYHALELLDQIVKRAPNFAEGWNKRATVYFFLNDHVRSLADIAKTLALEPRHFGALSGKGAILMAQKKYREALEVYRRATAINPAMEEGQTIVPMLKMMVGEKDT